MANFSPTHWQKSRGLLKINFTTKILHRQSKTSTGRVGVYLLGVWDTTESSIKPGKGYNEGDVAITKK